MSALREPQGVSSHAATLQGPLYVVASVAIDWTPMTGPALVSNVCSHVRSYVSNVCSHVSSHPPFHTTMSDT